MWHSRWKWCGRGALGSDRRVCECSAQGCCVFDISCAARRLPPQMPAAPPALQHCEWIMVCECGASWGFLQAPARNQERHLAVWWGGELVHCALCCAVSASPGFNEGHTDSLLVALLHVDTTHHSDCAGREEGIVTRLEELLWTLWTL